MSTNHRRLPNDDASADRPIVGPGREFATFNGKGTDDTFNGSGADDVAYGNGGNDTLNGNGGNDTLYGGDGNDVLDGGLGVDSVQGGNGFDTLTVDYSTAKGNQGSSQVYSDGSGGFYGNIYSGGYNFRTDFNGVEALTLKLGTGNDTLYVDAASVATGATLNLDGGAGADKLTIDFSALNGATNFTVAAGGAITSNRGTFAGFESFDLDGGSGNDTIRLGAGDDSLHGGAGTNTLNGGGGDDTIYSAGIDTVDGGAGNDTVEFDHDDGSDLSVSYDGSGGTASNGGTLASIENLRFYGGAGSDSVSVANASATVSFDYFASGGTDTLTVDYSATAGNQSASRIYSGGGANFYGNIYSGDYNYRTDFDGVDALVLKLGAANDTLSVDAAPVAGGATLNLDGGAGTDALTINFSALNGATNFTVAAGGAISSNRGTFAGFESFDVSSGSGNDTIRLGAGNDILSGGAGTNTLNGGGGDDTIHSNGVDTVDGGAGNDTVYFQHDDGSDLSVSYDGSAGTVSNGSTLASIENLRLYGGAGSDSLSVVNANATAYFDYFASGGVDTLTVDYSATAGNQSASRIYSGGGANFYGNIYSGDYNYRTDFDGVDALVLKLGAANDTLSVDAAPLATGATLNVDGGAGTDALTINFSALGGATNFTVAAGGAISSNRGTFASFEYFNITGGNGSDLFTAGAGDDVLTGGAGDDVLDGGAGTNALYGGTGSDTASYASATAGVTVTIKSGSQNTVGAGLDALDSIENLRGSNYNDTLKGSATANVIDGGAGNDKLDGQGGVDTASYASATAGVTVDLSLAAAQDTGGAGVDTLANFENLTGSSFDDVLTGTMGANVFVGGGGFDTVSYANSPGNYVTVDLTRQGAAQNTGNAGLDTLIGISGLVGSSVNDTLTGDANANTLEGGAGDDVLTGGPGSDTASYASAAGGVTVSLTLQGGAQATGGAGSDTLSGFENLAGSANADVLTGDANDNTLAGAAGDDTLTGGGGNDRLFGGAGTDTVVLSGAFADYDVVDNGDGTYTVTDLRAGAPDGVVTLSGVEQVHLSSGTYAVADVVNAAPVAVDDEVTGLVEAGAAGGGVAQAAGNVLGNDTDANLAAGVGETLTVVGAQVGGVDGPFVALSGATVVLGLYGTLTIDRDGTFTYQLDNSRAATDDLAPGQAAQDVFGYQIADAHGAMSEALLTFDITGADDTVAGADSLQVTRGRASSLDASVLLGNDTGAIGETLAVTAVSNAVGATVSLVDGKLVITASAATGGFDYTVATSGGGSATGHVDLSSIATPARITATAPAGITAVDYVGGAKLDTLTGGDGDDRLVGMDGKDRLDGGAGADRMEGGDGADTYHVDNAGDEVIETSAVGNDLVLVSLGAYTLGDGVENLTFVGAGDFTGTGNGLRNTMIGGAGNDHLSGGDNIDTLIGGAGNDILDGGAASDVASYSSATAGVTVDLRITTDQDTIGAGRDTLISIENVTGSAFADFLFGTDSGNTLSGGGNRDTLYGNGGADRLIGGGASDTVYGGTGADVFVFNSLDEISAGDRIADFSHSERDTIDFSMVDADVTTNGQQHFSFIGTAAFTGAGGTGYELRYQAAATAGDLTVQGDVNHDGVADFSFTVHAAALQSSDFLLMIPVAPV